MMAKRFGNFENSPAKKVKLEEDMDDLWGEDPNIDDIDDCIMLATQVLEDQDFSCTQRNNVSILPSYNGFRQDQHFLFTSTQSTANKSIAQPSTSGVNGFCKSTPIDNYARNKNTFNKNAFNKNTLNVNANNKNTNNQNTNNKNTNNQNTNNKNTNNNNAPDNFGTISSQASNAFKRPGDLQETTESLELKFKRLQEQYESKEGEVSILRSQLKTNKETLEKEHTRKQKEWTEKLHATTKQMQILETQLNFKNLEISNLKQSFTEVSKCLTIDKSLPQSPVKLRTQRNRTPKVFQDSLKPSQHYLNVEIEEDYPLKFLVSEKIFNVTRQETAPGSSIFTIKRPDNFPLLKNRASQDKLKSYPKTVLRDKQELDVTFAVEDIGNLCRLSNQELDLEKNNLYVNKVVCVCYQLLYNFNRHLQDLEKSCETEDIRHLDTLYLERKLNDSCTDLSIYDPRGWCKKEVGISCRRILAFVCELLPYSSYLQRFLLAKDAVRFTESEDYVDYFSVVKLEPEGRRWFDNCNFLNLILGTTKIIYRLRQSYQCPGFLSAVTLFITRICPTSYFGSVNEYVLNIFKAVVFTRPNGLILQYVSGFLREASQFDTFIKSMCKMASMNGLKCTLKQGITYYSADSCVLQVFIILYESNVLSNSRKYIAANLNVLEFVKNTFNVKAKWLHYQENNHCDCLMKMVKLTIEVIYETLQVYEAEGENSIDTNKFCRLFQCSIQILIMINFKLYDLVQKTLHREIISALYESREMLNFSDFEVESLERLLTEDMEIADVDVNSNSFSTEQF